MRIGLTNILPEQLGRNLMTDGLTMLPVCVHTPLAGVSPDGAILDLKDKVWETLNNLESDPDFRGGGALLLTLPKYEVRTFENEYSRGSAKAFLTCSIIVGFGDVGDDEVVPATTIFEELEAWKKTKQYHAYRIYHDLQEIFGDNFGSVTSVYRGGHDIHIRINSARSVSQEKTIRFDQYVFSQPKNLTIFTEWLTKESQERVVHKPIFECTNPKMTAMDIHHYIEDAEPYADPKPGDTVLIPSVIGGYQRARVTRTDEGLVAIDKYNKTHILLHGADGWYVST